MRDPANRTVLAGRMAFAVKAAHNTDPALYARLAVTAARLGLEPPSADALRAHLWEDRRFLRAGERLTARDTGLMVEFLVAGGGDAAARLLEALPEMSYALTAETAERLRAGPSATALQLRCRELLASTAVPHTLLVWVLRNRETVATWPLPSVYEQMAHALAVVDDATLTGENLRMQNQIHALFENARWFEAIFNELNSIQREAVFDRIQGSPSWDPTSHRSLLGRMIRLAPELAERRRSTAVPAPRQTGRWTSWRSLRERQVLYKRLVEVEIPKNSQDIATARSYGDLRENFEYHAARHQQGLLMQRKAEWDADLQQIRGTDFAGMATDRAGPGTRVTLVHADGRETVVNILGEWDRDETLGIVSNRSRLAQSIEGRQPGETASIPAETGEETVTVREVAAPDDAVRAWIGGGQPEIV
jgi:transcription elongation GreA/GreB family factor